MKYLKLLFIVFILNCSVFSEDYTDYNIKLYFELPEESIDQFIKTQVFPRPEGNYESQYYRVTLIQPDIEITSETITFYSQIITKVTIGSETIRYVYDIEVPVSIPAENISINEISGILQGIPDAINSQYGPQWLKNIIITAYNDLELDIYPQQFLNEINTQIPEDFDLEINDIGFGWEAVDGKLIFTLFVPIHARGPFVLCYNNENWRWFSTDAMQANFKFVSNVELYVIYYRFVDPLGTSICTESDLVIPAPIGDNDTGDPEILTVNSETGTPFPAGWHYLYIIFGTNYGWMQKTFSICNLP